MADEVFSVGYKIDSAGVEGDAEAAGKLAKQGFEKGFGALDLKSAIAKATGGRGGALDEVAASVAKINEQLGKVGLPEGFGEKITTQLNLARHHAGAEDGFGKKIAEGADVAKAGLGTLQSALTGLTEFMATGSFAVAARNLKDFTESAARTGEATGGVGEKLAKAAPYVTAFVAASGAAAVGAKELAERGADAVLSMDALSKSSGLGVGQILAFREAAEKQGIDFNEFARGLARMNVAQLRAQREIEQRAVEEPLALADAQELVVKSYRARETAIDAVGAAEDKVFTARGAVAAQRVGGAEAQRIADIQGPLTVEGAEVGLAGAGAAAESADIAARRARGERVDPQEIRQARIDQAEAASAAAGYNVQAAELRLRSAQNNENMRLAAEREQGGGPAIAQRTLQATMRDLNETMRGLLDAQEAVPAAGRQITRAEGALERAPSEQITGVAEMIRARDPRLAAVNPALLFPAMQLVGQGQEGGTLGAMKSFFEAAQHSQELQVASNALMVQTFGARGPTQAQDFIRLLTQMTPEEFRRVQRGQMTDEDRRRYGPVAQGLAVQERAAEEGLKSKITIDALDSMSKTVPLVAKGFETMGHAVDGLLKTIGLVPAAPAGGGEAAAEAPAEEGGGLGAVIGEHPLLTAGVGYLGFKTAGGIARAGGGAAARGLMALLFGGGEAAAGAVAGEAAGVAGGAAVGGEIGAVGGPVGAVGGAVIGAIVTAVGAYLLGGRGQQPAGSPGEAPAPPVPGALAVGQGPGVEGGPAAALSAAAGELSGAAGALNGAASALSGGAQQSASAAPHGTTPVTVESGGKSTTTNVPVEQASGGLISGSGDDTSDTIPIMASPNEYVIRASSVRKLGVPLLDRLNSGQYAMGGVVKLQAGGDVSAASHFEQQRLEGNILQQEQRWALFGVPPAVARRIHAAASAEVEAEVKNYREAHGDAPSAQTVHGMWNLALGRATRQALVAAASRLRFGGLVRAFQDGGDVGAARDTPPIGLSWLWDLMSKIDLSGSYPVPPEMDVPVMPPSGQPTAGRATEETGAPPPHQPGHIPEGYALLRGKLAKLVTRGGQTGVMDNGFLVAPDNPRDKIEDRIDPEVVKHLVESYRARLATSQAAGGFAPEGEGFDPKRPHAAPAGPPTTRVEVQRHGTSGEAPGSYAVPEYTPEMEATEKARGFGLTSGQDIDLTQPEQSRFPDIDLRSPEEQAANLMPRTAPTGTHERGPELAGAAPAVDVASPYRVRFKSDGITTFRPATPMEASAIHGPPRPGYSRTTTASITGSEASLYRWLRTPEGMAFDAANIRQGTERDYSSSPREPLASQSAGYRKAREELQAKALAEQIAELKRSIGPQPSHAPLREPFTVDEGENAPRSRPSRHRRRSDDDGGGLYALGGLVPARVSNGEYRMGASAVARHGVGFMNDLNAGRFAFGGPVTGGAPSNIATGGGSSGEGHTLDLTTNAGQFRVSASDETIEAIRSSAIGAKLTSTGTRPSWYS